MGQVECDDGNNIDGDGCSKDCKQESGYLCTTDLNGRDWCVDVIEPTAILKVMKKNMLEVQFTEPVKFTVDCMKLLFP